MLKEILFLSLLLISLVTSNGLKTCQYQYARKPSKSSPESVIYELEVPLVVSLAACVMRSNLNPKKYAIGETKIRGVLYTGDGGRYEPLLLARELLFENVNGSSLTFPDSDTPNIPVVEPSDNAMPQQAASDPPQFQEFHIYLVENFDRGLYDILRVYPSSSLEMVSLCNWPEAGADHHQVPLSAPKLELRVVKKDLLMHFETSDVISSPFAAAPGEIEGSGWRKAMHSSKVDVFSKKRTAKSAPSSIASSMIEINQAHNDVLLLSSVAIMGMCPEMLVFGGYERLPRYELLNDLAAAAPVLTRCLPTLVIDNRDDSISAEVLVFLERFYGASAIHWVLALSRSADISSAVVMDAHIVVRASLRGGNVGLSAVPRCLVNSLSVSTGLSDPDEVGENNVLRVEGEEREMDAGVVGGRLLWAQTVPFENSRLRMSDYGLRVSLVSSERGDEGAVLRVQRGGSEGTLLTMATRTYQVVDGAVMALELVDADVDGGAANVDWIGDSRDDSDEAATLRSLVSGSSANMQDHQGGSFGGDLPETPYGRHSELSTHAVRGEFVEEEDDVLQATFNADLLDIIPSYTSSEPTSSFDRSTVSTFESLRYLVCAETIVPAGGVSRSCVNCDLPLGRLAADVPPFTAILPLYRSVMSGASFTPRDYGKINMTNVDHATLNRYNALRRLRQERERKLVALCRTYITSTIVADFIAGAVWFDQTSAEPRNCLLKLAEICTDFVGELVKYREIMFQGSSTGSEGALVKEYHARGGLSSRPQAPYDSNFSTVPTTGPLGLNYDPNGCLEPVYCNHMVEFQRRALLWQRLPNSPVIEELTRNISLDLYDFDIGSVEAFAKRVKMQASDVTLPLCSFDGEYPYQEPWRHHDEYYNFTCPTKRYRAPQAAFDSSPTDAAVPTATDLENSCASTRLLVYEQEGPRLGIGALVTALGVMVRYAMCHNRTLVFNTQNEDPFVARWKFPGCATSTFECYFQPISSCSPTTAELRDAPSVFRGIGLGQDPVASARVVKMSGLPLAGHCSLCNDAWGAHSSENRGLGPFTKSESVRDEPFSFAIDKGGDTRFFDGLPTGEQITLGIGTNLNENIPLLGVLSRTSRRWFAYYHFGSYRGEVKLPWLSATVRFLLRPKAWFSGLLEYVVASTLRRGLEPEPIGLPRRRTIDSNTGSGSGAAEGDVVIGAIPHPYVSIHVRHGAKAYEQKLVDVDRYFTAIRKKYPHIRRVFMSTESAWTINYAVEKYPEFDIYHLDYHRISAMRVSVMEDLDYVYEFVFSFANLFLSVEADGFVGTLTSNWCAIIQYLQHTRGDGGMQYNSVDTKGSAYSQCY